MKYHLIVNQPFQSVNNVISATLTFLKGMDPGFKRLEDLWRTTPDGIALYDHFNEEDITIGIAIPSEEAQANEKRFFQVNDSWYKPNPDLSRYSLDNFLQLVNDRYGSDLFAVLKSGIGYGYFKVIPD